MRPRKFFELVFSVGLLLLATGSGLARGAQTIGSQAVNNSNAALGTAAPWFISTVDSTFGVGQYVSVAIDSSGIAYVSYYDATNTALKMAKYVGSGGSCTPDSAWECETVDGGVIGDMGRFSSIAIDPTTDLPVIAYWGSSLYLATAQNGGGWDIITISSGYGDYASVKVDATGAPHIAFRRYTSTSSFLDYARPVEMGTGNCGKFPGNYQCDVIDSGLANGHYPSLALDGSGQPRIAYRDAGNNALKYAYRNGGTWTIREILPTNSGTYASLDVDVANGDLPHIAHYDHVNGKLGYAVYVGSNGNCGLNNSTTQLEWRCDEIDAMGNQITHPRKRDVSMAVDSAGYPIIAYSWYYGAPLSARGFSRARPIAALGLQTGNCGPQDLWQCERIDGAFTGDHSAIAVGPTGLATIAYNYSQYIGALRVAHQEFRVNLPLVAN